jgi:hypothetical protein
MMMSRWRRSFEMIRDEMQSSLLEMKILSDIWFDKGN